MANVFTVPPRIVTGAGALTLILTGYAEKHGIAQQNISIDL